MKLTATLTAILPWILRSALWLVCATGCAEPPADPCTTVCVDTGIERFLDTDPDQDCDGYPASVDCDDSNCFIYPGAPREFNNGLDDDCDGNSDTYYGCGELGAAAAPVLALLWLPLFRRRRREDRTGEV